MGLLIDGKNDIIKKPLYQEINTADGYSISLSKNTYSTIYASSDLNVWSLKYYYNAGDSAYHVTLSSSKLSVSVPYNVGGTIYWEAEIEEREGGNDYLLKIRYFGIDAPNTIVGYKYELVIGSEQISDVTIEGNTTINGTLNATGNINVETLATNGEINVGEMTDGKIDIGKMTGGRLIVQNFSNDYIGINNISGGLIGMKNMTGGSLSVSHGKEALEHLSGDYRYYNINNFNSNRLYVIIATFLQKSDNKPYDYYYLFLNQLPTNVNTVLLQIIKSTTTNFPNLYINKSTDIDNYFVFVTGTSSDYYEMKNIKVYPLDLIINPETFNINYE